MPVYEYFVRNVAVMRRKVDSWVNATHILKVANFDKPQRTRILEKEVQKGTHEKVQGGYGKYQGTWVPLEVARELAYQYHVEDVLLPLFNFRESSTTPPPLAKRVSNAKGKGAAASRANSTASARLKSGSNGSLDSNSPASRSLSVANMPGSNSESQSKKAKKLPTFPTDSSSTPTMKRGRGRPPGRPSNASKAAAAATAQSGFVSPGQSYSKSSKIIPSTPLPPAKRQKTNVSPTPPGLKSAGFDDSMNLTGDSASVSSRSSSPSESLSDIDMNMLDQPTPRQTGFRTHANVSTPNFKKDSKQRSKSNKVLDSNSSGGTISLDSALTSSAYHDNDGNNGGSNILICDNELIAAQYGRKLLDYFMAPENDEIPDYLIHPPEGFNINHVIDDEGHTAFHWACSMGNLKIIVALLDAGANMHAVNLLGQTPLIRTVMFTNSYDLRSFSKIVELLRESIFHQDNAQRTVLHHIAESTAPRSKLSSARYYTEIFLAKLSESEAMNMIEMYVNRQDTQGDTALHIAARNQAKKCVKVLQSYHASSNLRNKAGYTPQDYINEYEVHRQKHSSHVQQSSHPPNLPPPTDATPHASTTYGNYPDHGYPQYQYAGGGENGYPKQNSSPTHAYTHVYSYDPVSTPAGENKYNTSHNHPPSSVQVVNGRSEKRYGMPMSTPPTRASRAFYDAHLFDGGAGSTASTIVNAAGGTNTKAYQSGVGGKIMAQYLPLVTEKFEQLARIYDSVIFDKRNDADQVKQLCVHAKDDVKSTKALIQEHVEVYGDETEAEKKSKDAENLVAQRIERLRKVVDRSQARDLATLVKQEEAKAGPEYQEELDRRNSNSKAIPSSEKADALVNSAGNMDPAIVGGTGIANTLATATDSTNTLKDEEVAVSDEDKELVSLAKELMDLQRRRREHVTEILDLWSTAGAGEKMNQYRRLVAMACGVKVDEIDGLLGEIEQVLTEAPKAGGSSS